jgi:chorismate mutase
VACDSARTVREKEDPFAVLVCLAVCRLLLGDEVAAAKYDAGIPIEDPVRERQLLEEMTESSRASGLDPAFIVRFFRAQIDASKAVQRGLYERWTSHPKSRPGRRPDLTAEVRPRVDAINAQLLQQLKAIIGTPSSLTGQAPKPPDTLDELHLKALRIALAPVLR